MQNIFADFDILALESDASEPGVFVKAIKPSKQQSHLDLDDYKLWSIITGKREAVQFAIQCPNSPPLKQINYRFNRYFARVIASVKRKISIF